MIVDLFGEDENGVRTFWEFNSNRTAPTAIPMIKENSYETTRQLAKIRHPHSNAFLDLNDDNAPDLFITTEEGFEVYKQHKQLSVQFKLNQLIKTNKRNANSIAKKDLT